MIFLSVFLACSVTMGCTQILPLPKRLKSGVALEEYSDLCSKDTSLFSTKRDLGK